MAHKYAEALVGSTAYAPSQLMELGQPEAFGVLDYHDRSVGHVYSDFYHGGGYHYACFSAYEQLHLIILFGRFHLSVHVAHPIVGEYIAYLFIPFFKALEAELLVFVDKRVDDICLPSFTQLLADERVNALPLVFVAQQRVHGFPARRELVDHRHVGSRS